MQCRSTGKIKNLETRISDFYLSLCAFVAKNQKNILFLFLFCYNKSMKDKNLREQLDGMKRPDLNRLAKDLKVKKVRRFKKDELINHLIEHFPVEDILKILNVPWWKRLRKYLPHIYGIATLIALICAFLFFHFSQKGDEKVHERIEKVENTLQRYDPLKRDELFKEKEKKIEELRAALQDECRGDNKERKEALAELEKGNPAKALALFERSIKTKSCNLAEDYYLKGNVHYSKKQPDYQQALEAYLEAAQLESGNAEYLNMVGKVYYILANYNKAIEYFKKALVLDTGAHGEEHPKVAIRWNNLGGAWFSLGNYQKAIRYFEKALAIDRKSYGEEHPKVAIKWNNLGSAWSSLGNYQKAIGYYEKALAIDRKSYGEEHPSVARDCNNLGLAWSSLGNYQKAIRCYQKALTIVEKMLGSQHPHTKLVKENLAEVEKKRSEEAKKQK